jgi:phosphoribosylanthranilate isomerase
LTWIKICGTTNPEDAMLGVEAGADALGFIFARSKRRVNPATAREIVQGLPPEVEKIGVFVDEAPATVLDLVEAVGLTAVQLHGKEDADYCRRLRGELKSRRGRSRVFKAIAVETGFERVLRDLVHSGGIDGVLFDSAPVAEKDAQGGTGRSFDWNRLGDVLPEVPEGVRVLVGGGLSAGSVAKAMQQLRPWGVDVCTGVEREPGRKDPLKVMAFVRAVRAAEEARMRTP